MASLSRDDSFYRLAAIHQKKLPETVSGSFLVGSKMVPGLKVELTPGHLNVFVFSAGLGD